ncbi:MAG: 16S rRNA (adenine(1518)-N(6)/adenine(1519)-N(6))-dimethyltransferase RsmA [Actinomycetota bacterium]|nr:16S rRNA (adenine(1518)-N(6)/adenine(1519)-N(6))-dimethyltransferase RsmA [Actinomycetota bacterium]
MNQPQLLGARRLRKILARHDVRPTKKLGQNFVVDPNTIRKVLSVADLQPEDSVLEVGAGAGSLTLGLAGVARNVVALECDPRLVGVLGEILEGAGNVDVVEADAMRLDLGSVAVGKLVSNLPYNVATPLVLQALEQAPQISHLTVMVQKEVGQRWAAGPGSKVYGQVSVMVAYWTEAEVVGEVSRRAFWPVPSVDSVIVRLVRREAPSGVDRSLLFAVVRSAFSQRRKTLRAALAPLVGSPQLAEDLCRGAGVASTARAEDTTLGEFVSIASSLEASGVRPGGPFA